MKSIRYSLTKGACYGIRRSNIAEGTVNTLLDAAQTNGGQNPLALLDPNRPQADFSSAKSDYRSEMMRRNLEGKLTATASNAVSLRKRA
ncbi:hypothetical protein BH24ACI1_BH24ACI1_16940 [soil metagenome]